MTVEVSYLRGPRDKRKGTLKNTDHPPEYINAEKEAKAKGYAPGRYALNTVIDGRHVYVWV